MDGHNRGGDTTTATDQSSLTCTEVITETDTHSEPETVTLRLRLTKKANAKTKSNRRVSWTADTVDNEFMGKKKSKCCCIYQKPKNWDESTDEDENEEECEHCRGHRRSDYNSKKDKENKDNNDSAQAAHNKQHRHSCCGHPNASDGGACLH